MEEVAAPFRAVLEGSLPVMAPLRSANRGRGMTAIGGEPDAARKSPIWQSLTDAVEKRFEGSVRATSIQKMSGKRNIDSNNHLPGFDCCARGVRRRLFQQHRSN